MATADETYLIDAWDQEVLAIGRLAHAASALQWQSPTRLAGWSFADVVAHVVDIESILAGDARSDIEPAWAALPHVDDDVARFTEIGVDARRDLPQAQVLEEFDDVHARLAARFEALPDNAEIASVTGRVQSLTRVLSMRCFDLWAHEQDLRDALGLPGDYDSPACEITLHKALELAAVKWQAQEHSPGSLTVTIVEPRWAQATHDLGGTGEALDLTCTLSEFLDIACGRGALPDGPWGALVVAP